MNRRSRVATALLALVLSGCTVPKSSPSPTPRFSTSAPTTPTPFATSKLSWTDCHSAFQCATLTVPLNYADLTMGTITLALIRSPARDQAHRVGSVVVNPGGPGGSGIDFLSQSATLFSNLNQRFDIVSFDPRGVGASTPVRCLSGPDMDAFIKVNPEPTTPSDVQLAIDASKHFADGCVQMSARILPYVGTSNAARDLDLIRDSIGDPKLTYIGFSYGTFLGAAYATLFPTHVRAMVLDGAVDPNLTTDQMATAQAAGFERNLQAFLANCAASSTCAFRSSGAPGPALDRLLAALTKAPLTVSSRTVGLGEAYLGILAALYSPSTWRFLGTALHNAQTGDGSLLLELADLYDERQGDGTYNNVLEANAAINCDDGPAPGSVAHLQQLGVQLQSVSPHFGTASAFGPLTCDFWPVAPAGKLAPSDVGAPPLIVVGGTNDPATPYAWAQSLAADLSHAVLVTRTGDGHVSYDKSSCVHSLADRYIIDPTNLPAAGTTCSTDG